MHRAFIPLLLLASVAITSTTTLPLLSANKLEVTLEDDGQPIDNIFSHRTNIGDILKYIIFKIPDYTIKYESPEKKPRSRKINSERSEISLEDFISQENAYNDEGFRKEQWHNYPRRLDRLQDYIFSSINHIKQVSGKYNKDNILGQHKNPCVSDITDKDVRTNEFELESKDNPTNIYDSLDPESRFILILKLRLACLKNQYQNKDSKNDDENVLLENSEKDNSEFELFDTEMSPANKVKREGVISEGFSSGAEKTETKTVSKRLFSLWSRLQSLSHRGHEVPHRRHMAFYSIPESSAGADGALNTQTRALMRPPGSPLRWG